MRESILTDFFSNYDVTDSSMSIVPKNHIADMRFNSNAKVYPCNFCGRSPAYEYYSLYISLDSNAYWNDDSFSYDRNFTDRFKALFGQDILKTKIKMAQKDYEGKNLEWRHYKAEGLKAAFDKLYQKPTDKFHGYPLQKVYNLTCKEYVRGIANLVVKVFSKRPEFDKYAKQYMQDALTKPDFEGQEFGNEVSLKLLGSSEGDCIDDYYKSRIVGIMLRRQCDGSLPVLLSSLKIMLKDYDPEYFAKVNAKF
jgi:hypothetical protein